MSMIDSALELDIDLSMLAHHLCFTDGKQVPQVLFEPAVVAQQSDCGEPLIVVEVFGSFSGALIMGRNK